MEKENHLINIEKNNNNNNSSVCYNIYILIDRWKRKDDYIWCILGMFYSDNDLGYSSTKIYKKLKNVGIGTVPNCIKRLLTNNLIYLNARNVGINKSEKYYKITEEGRLLFEEWLKVESKRHIQKKLNL